jgi:competence protein ComEA
MKRFLLLLVTLLFSALALAAVNINTATKEELDALPEIGPVKAQAIIDYRTANGPFKTPEEIMKVNGIKEGTFAKVKGMISVSGASTPVAPTGAAKSDAKSTAPSGMQAAPSGMQPPPAAKSAAPATPAVKSAPAAVPSGTPAAAPATPKAAAGGPAPSASAAKDAKTMKAEKAAADKEAKAKAKADADAAAKAKKDAKAAEAQAKKDAKAAAAKAKSDAKEAKADKGAAKGDAAMKSADKDEKAKK